MEQDFFHFLQQLEQHLMTARRVPFTDKVLVDEELMYELVDRLHEALPDALDRAERILKDRDQIIHQAQERAEETVQGAEEYVQRLASETNVVRVAEQQAEELTLRAREAAREIQLGSREYADELLGDVQQTLERCLELIRGGRSELQVAAASEHVPSADEEVT